jgi:hypothetical protein
MAIVHKCRLNSVPLSTKKALDSYAQGFDNHLLVRLFVAEANGFSGKTVVSHRLYQVASKVDLAGHGLRADTSFLVLR